MLDLCKMDSCFLKQTSQQGKARLHCDVIKGEDTFVFFFGEIQSELDKTLLKVSLTLLEQFKSANKFWRCIWQVLKE